MHNKPTTDPKPAATTSTSPGQSKKNVDKPDKAELDKADLDKVSGGVNPQPLPPHRRPI
jgi:hypothetical protein